MSEEGEADFDAGQILEDVLEQFPDEAKCSPRHERHPATGSNSSGRDGGALDANGSDTATGAPAAKGVSDTIRSAHRNSGYIDGSRRGEHDMRYGEALPPRSPGPNRRTSDEDYYHRQGTGRMRARSRSKHRSQSREYVRRAPPEYENNYESVPLRRGEQPRPDEGEHRESPYRPNRYGERDFSRSAYYRRTEREPSRYKRRETERQPYSHTGYNAREGADGGDAERRNVDKDRAIEELRLRVRATSDRPADDLTSGTRDRSPLAVHVPAATREPGPATATRPTEDSLAMRDRSASEMEVVKPQTSGDTAPVNSEGAVQLGPSVDMDDIEEGEHIEGEMEAVKLTNSEYGRGQTDVTMRSRSRSRYGHSRLPYANRSPSRGRLGKERSRSRSRPRAYHGADDRRTGGGRDYPSDSAYRRRYDNEADRGEIRARESYENRPARYPKYDDAAYGPRHGGRARSPSDVRESAYRSERRHYGSRYDRYGGADSRVEADPRQPPHSSNVSPSRRRSKSRSHSPAMSRDGSRPAARAGYGDRYSHASRPSSRGAASYSRSPSRYAREASGADAVYSTASERRRAHYSDSRWPGPDERTRSSPSHQMAIDEARPGVSDSANPLPPPPPPPPPSTQRQGSPSRGYSSRMYRRRSRTPKRDTGNSARTPYAGRHEYDAHGKSLSNGGSYHASAQHSRGHSPGANAGAGAGAGGPAMAAAEPAAPPALVLPAFSHGTDLFISRFPELDEWLKARAQVREQDKRILELSAAARRTGFELSYAGWAVQQAEGQAQLAMWHIERAEQGLDAVSGWSLITASTPGEL